MATCKMAAEAPGHTLQPTALVHEAWLKLVDTPAQSWQNRAHFFGAAAEAMRRILIARARRKNTQRRGNGVAHVDANEIEIASAEPDDQLLALDEALTRYATIEPKQAELVKLRYFAGMTIPECAEALAISARKADQLWAYARAWLLAEMGEAPASCRL